MDNLSKRIIIFFTICLSISSSISAASDFTPQYKPTLNVPHINSEVKIDGDISDPAWRQAGVADNFAEVNPGDQIKPMVESRALIMYDDKNLYVALIAHDDPSTIRTSFADRDAIFRDDYFGIMLDTYGDQTWGYEIFVNPYGMQGDLRMTNGQGEDGSFDIVWESVGIVTDSGYQVEIAIPFASLRFPDKQVQTWRCNFWRDQQRDLRRKYAWAAQDRDNPCFLCQWGYLTGIENIKPGKNIELIPNIVASQFGEREDYEDPDTKFNNEDPDAEVSFSGRYGITSNSSIELTLNPDFSQVESDEAQIDVNETFGLFFSERRPFFQEGSEMFDSWLDAIYTRSINDPVAAVKYTAQFGRTGLAVLSAKDENSPILVPLQQQARYGLAEDSYVNIIRSKKTFGEDSFVGLMFTDRRYDDFGNPNSTQNIGGSGTTFGIDANIRFAKHWRIEGQTLLSKTEEINDAHIDDDSLITSIQPEFDNGKYTVDLDGESYWGDGTYLSLERNGRTWNFDMDYWAVSPTFRTDAGFNRSNDYRQLSVWTGFFMRPNKKYLTNIEPSISFGRKWAYDGKMDLGSYGKSAFDEWLRFELYTELRWQSSFYLNYVNSQERFFGVNFPGISKLYFEFDTRFSEFIGGGASYSFGRTIWRDREDPDLGYINEFTFYANIKPTERTVISPSFVKAVMDRRASYLASPQHTGEPTNIFDATIFRLRGTYQFNRNLFVRLVVQYVDEKVINDSQEYDKSRFVSVEPFVSYKINAFTKFFVGMASGYDYVLPDSGTNTLTDAKYSLSHRTIFAKLQYLFRM